MVRVPGYPQADSTKPLLRCLTKVSHKTGMTTYQVALAMSEFFEAVAMEMVDGNVVSIPGFGVFGAKVMGGRGPWRRQSIAYPAFIGCRTFRTQMRETLEPHRAPVDKMNNRRKSNHPRAKMQAYVRNPNVSIAGTQFRSAVRRLARQNGVPL